ncbi:FHA domain-containing protein [Candidatus Thiothrix anitrata]|jgi:hypothetical protein|uniref:FHA domain-containing protein n=1 Tax=Candidatus Thiothrix anitrata TaxID=2823902 RepID=A0ABX7X403_9GAMM|nr:FHA domain-containing protein [Candidatus Thiothrix anitrata]QTR50604.1 FHA domain-containing protein [Candidatus Thiothrix anitrata]
MAKVIIEVQTRGLNQYHRVDSFPLSIGRALDNDVILSDSAVSPYHLRLEQGENDALFLQNLSRENGTSMDSRVVGEQPVRLPVPSRLMLGNRRVNVLAADTPVAATNLLKFNGFFSALSNPVWAILLVVLTALSFLAENYMSTFFAKGMWYYFSDLLLNMSVLFAFALVLSGVTWLVSHRWTLVSAISMTALLALLKSVFLVVGGNLAYFVTSIAPLEFAMAFYNLLFVALMLYLYQRWASYLRPIPAIGLALLLSSPLLVLEGLDWLDQVVMDGEFSSDPLYDQTLSSFNLHAAPTVSLENYMQQASEALPSQVEE